MSDKREMKSPEERAKALEEALKRIRPKVTENKGSVQDRLGKIATQTIEEPTIAKDKKKDKKKPMSMEDLAKRSNKFDEKVADAKKKGVELSKPSKDKESGKDKDKDKDKEKDKSKEMTPEKQEAKMKEMFSKIKLPSGMEIHQEGPQWVLVAKDGKQRTDVTDVMNTIDKFNRNIDTANEANRVQNAAQGKADNVANNVANDASRSDIMKDSGFKVNATNDKAMMVGEALPKVKDVNGNQVFKPEDIKTVAEKAVSFSDEKAKLEKLKDPKALEEMRKREKRNEKEADRQALLARSQEQSRGGR
ncbi:MAG: hypothetical protein J6C85_06590 [Alphaproteobacteria bacterium]|nr:hypothetical protein [Alphaproteobacteria bacterium]